MWTSSGVLPACCVRNSTTACRAGSGPRAGRLSGAPVIQSRAGGFQPRCPFKDRPKLPGCCCKYAVVSIVSKYLFQPFVKGRDLVQQVLPVRPIMAVCGMDECPPQPATSVHQNLLFPPVDFLVVVDSPGFKYHRRQLNALTINALQRWSGLFALANPVVLVERIVH